MKSSIVLLCVIFCYNFYISASESSQYILESVVFSIRNQNNVYLHEISPEDAKGKRLFCVSHLSGVLQSSILEGFLFRNTASGALHFSTDFNKPEINSYSKYTLEQLPKSPDDMVAYSYRSKQ